MDIATLIGIISGIGLIAITIITQGNPKIFFNVGSILIVFGGTFAATLINYPLKEVLSVMGVVKNVFTHKAPDSVEIIKKIVKLADLARREGILALEREMSTIEDEFLRQGIQLAVDGTEPDQIRAILGTELSNMEERHDLGQGIFKSMGAFSPAFGMIGTLIGLVLMLATMSDPSTIGPSMAIALITTFYGAVLANLLFLPIAGKLKTRSKQEMAAKELVLEGVMAIQSGDNPRIVEQKLITYVPPNSRKEFAEEKAA